MRPCLILYGGLYLVSLLWCALAGRPLPYLGLAPTGDLPLHLGAGLALGAGTVLASRIAQRHVAALRDLAMRFREILGPLRGSEIFLVAFASAFGEEAFFRGAMQPSFGLVTTTLIFGFLHAPVDGLTPLWTLFALAMGLALGGLASWEGGLVAATTAHFAVNFTNLHLITRLPLPEKAAVDGGSHALQGREDGL